MTPTSRQSPHEGDAPLRIVLAADTFWPEINGASRSMARLAAGLVERGHDVHIVAPSYSNRHVGPQLEEHEGRTMTVHRLYSWRWFPHPWLRFALPWRVKVNSARILDLVRPDVVHFNSPLNVGRAMSIEGLKRGIRLVGTSHFMPEVLVDYAVVPRFLERWTIRRAWVGASQTFGRASAVTASTRRAAQYLEDHTSIRGVLAISNGIALDTYAPNMNPRNDNLILYVGRLSEGKRVSDLIRAFARLDTSLNSRLEIVGGGDQESSLKSLARQLGVAHRVNFTGYVDEAYLRNALTRATLFAMPSIEELQSIATMEAMASGLPVVAANAMALPHLVHHGENGFLFDPGDVSDFAEKLNAVLTMSDDQIIQLKNESLRIIGSHDIQRTLDTLESIYRGEALVADPVASPVKPKRVNKELRSSVGYELVQRRSYRMQRKRVLENLDLGGRVAEDDPNLAAYFVETETWRSLSAGEVDIVFGSKGSGKSALYSHMNRLKAEFASKGIEVVAAGNVHGSPVFSELVTDHPQSETEFIALWKLFVIAHVGSVLVARGLQKGAARQVRDRLVELGLLSEEPSSVRDSFRRVRNALKRLVPSEIAQTMSLDPATGGVAGFTTALKFDGSTTVSKSSWTDAIDQLLALADTALEDADISVWIMFDRLDVAFRGAPEVERAALGALFRAYLDLVPYRHTHAKIFLRSDIWQDVAAEGFREASHVTRQHEINWASQDLLDLVARRLVANGRLLTNKSDVLDSFKSKREFVYSILPPVVEEGGAASFEWIIQHVQDGTKMAAPREVIHLLQSARGKELARLGVGHPEAPGTALFSGEALQEAMQEVSKTRLEQTIFAEYPWSKQSIALLADTRSVHDLLSLQEAWGGDVSEVAAEAEKLVGIGFFEKRGTRSNPSFSIPHLYRPVLRLEAESGEA